jgi:hypothetical protein
LSKFICQGLALHRFDFIEQRVIFRQFGFIHILVVAAAAAILGLIQAIRSVRSVVLRPMLGSLWASSSH